MSYGFEIGDLSRYDQSSDTARRPIAPEGSTILYGDTMVTLPSGWEKDVHLID